jgi:hypothetical protein
MQALCVVRYHWIKAKREILQDKQIRDITRHCIIDFEEQTNSDKCPTDEKRSGKRPFIYPCLKRNLTHRFNFDCGATVVFSLQSLLEQNRREWEKNVDASFPDNPRMYIAYGSIKVDDPIKFNVTSKDTCTVSGTDRPRIGAKDYVILITSLFYHGHVRKKLRYGLIIFNKMNMDTLLCGMVLRDESHYDIQSQNT